MLLEGRHRAGVSSQLILARPCMALPAALRMGGGQHGCVGNRVYTDIDDADFYIAVQDATGQIAEHTYHFRHEPQLFEYHQDRRAIDGGLTPGHRRRYGFGRGVVRDACLPRAGSPR